MILILIWRPVNFKKSLEKKHEKKTSYAVLHSPKYAGTISVIMQFFRPVSRMGCRAYGSWPEARITNLLRSSTSSQKRSISNAAPVKSRTADNNHQYFSRLLPLFRGEPSILPTVFSTSRPTSLSGQWLRRAAGADSCWLCHKEAPSCRRKSCSSWSLQNRRR